MRKIAGNDFKTVDYFGIELTIDNKLHYLATTNIGDVIASNNPLVLDPKCGWLSEWEDFTEIVATVDLEGMDWKDTLVEVE